MLFSKSFLTFFSVRARHYFESANPHVNRIHGNHSLHALKTFLVEWILVTVQTFCLRLPMPFTGRHFGPLTPRNRHIHTSDYIRILPDSTESLLNSRSCSYEPASLALNQGSTGRKATLVCHPIFVLKCEEIVAIELGWQYLV